MHSVGHITNWVRHGWADIDIEILAKAANTAPHYYRRIFRDATGAPVLRFVRWLRLELAAYRLVFTAEPIIDIAISAGYSSAAAFSRAFRDQYGSCPADVRALRLEAPWPSDGPCCQGADTGLRQPQVVAFLRCFGRMSSLHLSWRRLASWSAQRAPEEAGGRGVLVCYDDPERYLGEPMRYDVGLVVGDDFEPRGGIGIQLLPAAPALTTRHVGPAEFLPFSYMHVAVAAAVEGLAAQRAVLPFFVEYQHDPRARGLRIAADVGVLLAGT